MKTHKIPNTVQNKFSVDQSEQKIWFWYFVFSLETIAIYQNSTQMGETSKRDSLKKTSKMSSFWKRNWINTRWSEKHCISICISVLFGVVDHIWFSQDQRPGSKLNVCLQNLLLIHPYMHVLLYNICIEGKW